MTAGRSAGVLRLGRAVLLLSLAAATAARAADAEQVAPPPRKTFREALRTFGRDGGYLFTFPGRVNRKGVWATTGVLAATALVMNRDEEIRANVIESDRPAAGRLATKFEPLGRTEVEAAALGTMYLAGRAAGNERVSGSAATAFEAFLWTALVTSAAKGIFGRESPGRGSGEGEFFSGDTIFPSGHTARSFAIAAVFSARGGRKAAWFAYPIATLIGLSTVQEDKHWASDVVAGAGLGLAIGKGIAGRHPAATPAAAPGVAWSLVPRSDGAALQVVF
jgi:membrane-associated phospholipid phosphatase